MKFFTAQNGWKVLKFEIRLFVFAMVTTMVADGVFNQTWVPRFWDSVLERPFPGLLIIFLLAMICFIADGIRWLFQPKKTQA